MKAWSEFEQTIDSTNQFYLRKGYGVVEKIPNGTKTIRQKGVPITVPTNKTGCDFIGHLKGQPIAFDCKSCEIETSFPFGTKQKPTLAHHQKEFLLNFKRTGGTAFVLIQLNKLHRVFLIDIDEYINLQKTLGRKSIPLKVLENYKVFKRGYFYDYLKNLEGK